MANTELDETKHKLRSSRIEVRFYLVLLIFIAITSFLVAQVAIYYIRKDNEHTRHLICQIVEQVQLKADDCVRTK
jgi:hypothetical protein